MVDPLTGLVLAGLLAGGLLFCAAAAITRRGRSGPAASSFLATTAVAGLGTLLLWATVALGLPDPATNATAVVFALLLPVPWLLFSLQYTGRDDLVTTEGLGLVVTPVVLGVLASALVFGPQALPGVSLPSPGSARGVLGAFVFVVTVTQTLTLLYVGGLQSVATGLLLLTFRDYEHLDPSTGALLGVLGTVPWLSLLFGLLLDGTAPLALPVMAAAGSLVGGGAATFTLARGVLFGTVAAAGNVGPETVVADLGAPVVVTNAAGTVVQRNGAATTLVANDPVGEPVDALLGADIETIRGSETVKLLTDDGLRLFEPSVSELSDQRGRGLGYAVVLRDVTEQTVREQRLEVFNRVLRHNLRNETMVLLGNAQRLRTAVDAPEMVETADTLMETTQDLSALAENVRELEGLLADDAQAQWLRPADICRTVIEAYDDDERVRTTCDIGRDIEVEAPRKLLRAVFENLVENAVEHSEEPVEVVIEADFDAESRLPLSLTVTDNGPGIPDLDRTAVMSGTEDPLQHSRGLGLWLVRWTVTRLGGELDIGTSESGDTAVSFTLPNARRRTAVGTAESALD